MGSELEFTEGRLDKDTEFITNRPMEVTVVKQGAIKMVVMKVKLFGNEGNRLNVSLTFEEIMSIASQISKMSDA